MTYFRPRDVTFEMVEGGGDDLNNGPQRKQFGAFFKRRIVEPVEKSQLEWFNVTKVGVLEYLAVRVTKKSVN